MVLKNHIAYDFITNDNIALQLIEGYYPKEYEAWKTCKSNEGFGKIQRMFKLLSIFGQKAYVITETVINNLELLKIDKVNWDYLEKIPNGKFTYILPSNQLIRISHRGNLIEFCYCKAEKRTEGEYLNYTLFYVNTETGEETIPEQDKLVNGFDKLLIFKIICFMYLTENNEEIIGAGKVHGTRKTGKIKNDFTFPITVVNSKWNTTSIRTEGFNVSGHFRFQPCGKERGDVKLIFIDPFVKNGYKRSAGKLTQ